MEDCPYEIVREDTGHLLRVVRKSDGAHLQPDVTDPGYKEFLQWNQAQEHPLSTTTLNLALLF